MAKIYCLKTYRSTRCKVKSLIVDTSSPETMLNSALISVQREFSKALVQDNGMLSRLLNDVINSKIVK